MFRLPLLIVIALAIAFAGGIWSTRKALDATIGFGAIKLGPWEAFPEAQTDKADPYAKSHRANAGRLLLGSAEGLTFTAALDDAGQPLTSACRYTISGRTPQARFWTLSAQTDGVEPASATSDLPTALNSRTVLRREDGSFAITVSGQAQPGNWLALSPTIATLPPSGRNLRLILTLLDTPTAGSSGLIDLAMPRIEKAGCTNG